LVVCLAQVVLCTWLIIWLRLGTFSLVLRVMKLGVADSFLW